MEIPEQLQPALAADDGGALAELLAAPAAAASELRRAALRAACILGAPECARVATAGQDDVLLADSHSFTPLHHAARGGHLEVLRLLLESLGGGPVDVPTDDVRLSRLSYLCGGVTPLHLAAASGSAPSVAALLAARADAAAEDALAGTLSPQEYEAATRRRCEERCARVEPTEFGRLLAEAEQGRPGELRSLLRGGDVKNMRISSSPLLQAAAALGSPAGLRVILEVLSAQGRPGHDPEAAKELALPGLNELGPMGFAPLHTAVETGFPECVAPLLEARADVNVLTADASCQLGQTSTVYTEGGRTALHIAVEKADLEAVEALLAGGARADEADSFGRSPRDLALEAVAAPESRVALRPRVAALLGPDGWWEDEVAKLDADAVRARRAERQRLLRERVAAADASRRREADAELLRAVRERYAPLDAAVARGELGEGACGRDLVAWAAEEAPGPPPFKRVCGVSGSRETGVECPLPGVFVFQLLSEALCGRIWAETEHYLAQAEDRGLPLPVRHDGGLDLSKVFPELLQAIADAATPAIRAMLPPELRDVSLKHAFRTKNFVGREERLVRHVDKYAVTLNVCIRKTPDVEGSGVFFYESQTSPEPVYRHEHAVGLAVLHSSKEWHQTEPLTSGERGSIIMWFSHGAS